MRGKCLTRRLVGLLTVLCCAAIGALAQESQDYRIDRVTATLGATVSESADYETRIVVAQESPDGIGSSCTSGTVNGLGFFSVLGARPAPIILTLKMSEVIPGAAHLSWSGVEERFEVFRGSSAEGLVDPANLYQQTASCGTIDGEPAVGGIVFYRVMAASPVSIARLAGEMKR